MAGCARPVVGGENRAFVTAVEGFRYGSTMRNRTMLRIQRSGGTVPIILLIVSGRIAALPIGIALALSTASVQAADVDAFLAGTSRNCVECNLSGGGLQETDLKSAQPPPPPPHK